MRILRGSDAIVNIGGLYRYPYPVNLRNQEKNDIIRDLEAYHLFVVLEVSQKVSGNYLKVLTTTGEIGIVLHNPRYLKQVNG